MVRDVTRGNASNVRLMHYQHYNILSLNVNGLNIPVKRSEMISKIKKEKINVAFWQETHLSDNEHEKLFFHHTGKEKGGE